MTTLEAILVLLCAVVGASILAIVSSKKDRAMRPVVGYLAVVALLLSLGLVAAANAQVAHVRQPDGTWVKVVPSPDDTVIQAGSTASILDASNNVWTLPSTGIPSVNGVPDLTSYNVQELAYEKGLIWQYNGISWYSKLVPLWSSPTKVNPIPGTAVLSWTMPTSNLDGSPLTDLGGFVVSYGTNPTTLTQTVTLPATTLSYTVSGLTPGAWYFEVAAITTLGLSGAESIEASKTIP